MRSFILAGLLSAVAAIELPVKLETKRAIDSSIANIHVHFSNAVEGSISYTYGDCSATGAADCDHHIGHSQGRNHDRLVWRIPDGTQLRGCVSAWNAASELIGRSASITIQKRRVKRTVVAMDNSSHIDAEGPWFDGVALLAGTNISTVDVDAAKAKDVAIVGAGMAGLMTWLCLHQAGFKNLQIIEAAQRLGGRVHTAYFGEPSDRLYQEMGPMRFPKSITDKKTNTTFDIQDHKLTFDLAAELNRLNGNDKNFSVDFIKWYQSSQAGLQCTGMRKADGSCPTLADISSNASLAAPEAPMSPDVKKLTGQIESIVSDPDFVKEVATNMFEAHKHWLDRGLNGLPGDQWSEFAYIHDHLKYSLNATDQVLNSLLDGAADGAAGTFWDTLFEGVYFSATDWRTIDGGLSRLPSAFYPLVGNVTTMNRKVTKMGYDEDAQRVQLYWKDNYTQPFQNASYDYAVTTVPFALMRMWQLPVFSALKLSAIQNYGYTSVCKVALKFNTRFWEHLHQPIYGSCSTTTDLPGIGSICYPSYDINSTGPGVMLASYTGDDAGLRWPSVPEQEHVQYVVDAMADIHGDVVYDQYSGEYNRRCWLLDPYETISWASASVGQRQLYMPSFFQTEKGVIIGGEGSSYTSSWISSALESAIRSSVQLMLELGLVDEAKATVEKWMARWISV